MHSTCLRTHDRRNNVCVTSAIDAFWHGIRLSWQHPQLSSLAFRLMSPTPQRKTNAFMYLPYHDMHNKRRFYIQCTKSKTYTVFILHPFFLTNTSHAVESIKPSQKQTCIRLFSIHSELATKPALWPPEDKLSTKRRAAN